MQLSKRRYFYFLPLFFSVASTLAQKDAQNIYDGNEMYHSGKVTESTEKYRRALEINPNNRKANFNLGNALYKNAQLIKEGKISVPANAKMTPDSLAGLVLDQAAQNFAVVANSISDTDTLHRAWHNTGNCYLLKKDYKQAVEAYKKALKFNSKDEETRYNLAYALKHLPPEQKKGGGGQNKPQPKENKEDKKQQKQDQSQMSKEQAEQLLKAMMDNERKLQDKRKQKQEDVQKSSIEKDW